MPWPWGEPDNGVQFVAGRITVAIILWVILLCVGAAIVAIVNAF